MIQRIDEWVLDAVGWLAARVESAIGYDCLLLARLASVIAVASWIYRDMRGHRTAWTFGLDALILISDVFGGIDEDEAIRSACHRGLRNHRRVQLGGRIFRLMWAFVFVGDLCMVHHYPGAWVAPAGFFGYSSLRCCDPIGGGGRFQRYLKGLFQTRQLVPVPESS